MTRLPYKVEARSDRPFFEAIAAFDCEAAALNYAGECALSNTTFSYRVMRGRKVLSQLEPEA